MALLFMDSFDHYATADITEKWSSLSVGSDAPASIGAFGRRSSNGFRISDTAGSVGTTSWTLLGKALTHTGPTCVVGFAFKKDRMGSRSHNFLQILDGSTVQVSLFFNVADATVSVLLGDYNGGTVLQTTSVAITPTVFYYIEFKVTIDPTVGSFSLKFNGTEVASGTNVNTRVSSLSQWSAIRLCQQCNSGAGAYTQGVFDFDDVYVLDGSGSAPWNDFLGDCRVDAMLPTAEGAVSDWAPSTGTNNALLVDDNPPNDDTDYVSTVTPGHTDTYVTPDAPVAGATIHGVQANISLRKEDAGNCPLSTVVRHGSTNYSTAVPSPGTTYAYQHTPYQTNPGTGVAWTEVGFNAAEFRVYQSIEGAYMALLFMDSFDHYATADITKKWTSLSAGGTAPSTIGATSGRRSSKGFHIDASTSAAGSSSFVSLIKTISHIGPTCVVGFAFKKSTIGSRTHNFLQILDGSVVQTSLRFNTADSTVSVMRGDFADTVLFTTSAAIGTGTFYYVEFKVLIDPTVGSFSLRFNGTEVAAATGVNTRFGTVSQWTGINLCQLCSGSAGAYTQGILDFDDLYVLDGSGSAPWNDFLGDCRVDAVLPTAESATGGTNDWTPSTGTNNAALLDEATPNDDTDYVSSITPGHTDVFAVPSVPSAGSTVYGVQVNLDIKKEDTGVCPVSTIVRQGGVNYPTLLPVQPTLTYAYQHGAYGANPATGVAWVEADFNAAEFGFTRG